MPQSESAGSDRPAWIPAGSMSALTREGRIRVRSGTLDILLVSYENVVYACDNTCAHQHFSMLHSGTLSGCLVTCPMHGWTFDVRSGLSTTGEGRIPTYPVIVRGDEIFIGRNE